MEFDIETFHATAVQTPSNEDVGPMRDVLVKTLTEAGYSPRVDGLGNVIVSRGGADATGSDGHQSTGPHLVLNTHIDTVSPHIPYAREGDVVRGRGACDAKGPLAALVAAFLRTDPGSGRLTLAITPNEETIQTGAARLKETLSADGYIVGEPTDLDVCIAARGQCEATITVSGAGGHAASVPLASNPVYGVGRVLEALSAYDEQVGPDAHELLGAPKLTPTILSGGDTTNRVPEACQLTVDRRSVPPETSDSFQQTLQAYVNQHVPETQTAEVELIRSDTPFPDAFVTDRDAPLVSALQSASDGSIRPFSAATEASYFAQTTPTVVFGPGVLADNEGAVAHSPREYVRLSEVRAAADAISSALTTLFSTDTT